MVRNLMSNIRFALQRIRGRGGRQCTHLDQIRDVLPASVDTCPQCVAVNDAWVHLRVCMTCGAVGCCDSSKNKHAHRHATAHAPGHQVVRSLQPGEDWMWCFADETLVDTVA